MSLDPETDFYGEFAAGQLLDEKIRARRWARAWKTAAHVKDARYRLMLQLLWQLANLPTNDAECVATMRNLLRELREEQGQV